MAAERPGRRDELACRKLKPTNFHLITRTSPPNPDAFRRYESALPEIPGPKRMARLKLVKTRYRHGRTG